jgi:hypothetical protein
MNRAVTLLILVFALPAAGQDKTPYSCESTAEHRQFDFWLGNWEVTDKAGDTVYGHNRISLGEKGCLLLEEWKSSRGGTGTSINYYNPVTDQWHQDWVDAGASIINTHGGMKNGSMAMRGKIYYLKSGRRADFRARWTPMEDGRVRQFFQEKDDKGQWQTWFEGFYRRVE